MSMLKLMIWPALFLWLATTGHGQEEGYKPLLDQEAFLEKVTTYSMETSTIQSDFTQEKHLTMLEEVLVSEGHFIFQKENSVVWSYTHPVDYTIIVHKGKFIIKEGDQVNEFDIASNRMFKEINNMIVTSVSGNFLNNSDFQASYLENEKFYLAKLVPLKPEVKDMLREIAIYFDKKNMEVAKVKFMEPGDDFTLITFSGKILNQPVPEEVFNIQH